MLPSRNLGMSLLPLTLTITTSDGYTTLDATTDYVSVIFVVPKTGTIDTIKFKTGSCSLVGTLSARFFNVDAAGDPNMASVYGGCAQIDDTTPTAAAVHTMTGLGCSATAGDKVALVIWASALTSGTVAILTGVYGTSVQTGFPYGSIRTTGTGAGSHIASCGAYDILYSDGSRPVSGVWPICTVVNALGLDNDSTVRRVGNKITMPFRARVIGMFISADVDYDAVLRMYAADGTTELATCTMVATYRYGTATAGHFWLFDGGAEVILENGQTVIAAITTTSIVAASVNIRGVKNLTELAAQDQFDLGQNCHGVQHNGTAWSDFVTERYNISLIVSAVDDGTGVGAASMSLGI